MDNKKVADLFLEMAELLDIEGGDPYRVRTFRRAAHLLEELAEPVASAIKLGSLQRRRGVGPGVVTRIGEMLRRGSCRDLDRLRARMPTGVRELLKLEGMGPKTVRLLHAYLGVGSLDELEAAVHAGKLSRLPRFGPGSNERVLAAIAELRSRSGRLPLPVALRLGGAVVEALSAHPAVEQATLTGSARRRKELVGDLDVLVASSDAGVVAERFSTLPMMREVLVRGTTRTAARLQSGHRIDLRVIPPETYGAGLHYFTGSKRHNIAVRALGNRRGLKISEYGVFLRASERLLAGAAEADVFAAIGLPYIPPELREDDGELEAARSGRLPQLVEEHDLRGDLNVHTRGSDGSGSLRAMALAAAARGLSYLAFTDHSACQGQGGLDGRRLLAQGRRLRQLEGELGGPRLLAGAEVEVLPDGTLALDPLLLSRLDWVVAGVHRGLEQSAEELTRRLVTAMESGVIDCIAHPTGRLLGERDALPLDLEGLLRAALRRGVALELNGSPRRLDLDAATCRQAREVGVPIALASGAHAPGELGQLQLAVYTARRGWLEPRDVVNAAPLERLLEQRRDRLRRGGVQVPEGSPLERPTRLRAELARPLSAALRERLHAWLARGGDPALASALAALSDNPVQKALELLWLSQRRPQAAMAAPELAEPVPPAVAR